MCVLSIPSDSLSSLSPKKKRTISALEAISMASFLVAASSSPVREYPLLEPIT